MKNVPCCRNCEHYYRPLCMVNTKNGKHIKTSPNDWCIKWSKDWEPTKKELEDIGFFKKEKK